MRKNNIMGRRVRKWACALQGTGLIAYRWRISVL